MFKVYHSDSVHIIMCKQQTHQYLGRSVHNKVTATVKVLNFQVFIHNVLI